MSPDIAMAADGSLAVSWSGNGVGDLHGVVQRFAADGTRIGGETRVNTTISGCPDLVFNEGAAYRCLEWRRAGRPGRNIFRRIMWAAVRAESRVNTGTLGLQQNRRSGAGCGRILSPGWASIRSRQAEGLDILSQQIDLATTAREETSQCQYAGYSNRPASPATVRAAGRGLEGKGPTDARRLCVASPRRSIAIRR
jgi:hypothetical protein